MYTYSCVCTYIIYMFMCICLGGVDDAAIYITYYNIRGQQKEMLYHIIFVCYSTSA